MELIDKAALINVLQRRSDELREVYGNLGGAAHGALRLVDNAPLIDAVEVVFCKNCQHRETINCITSEKVNDDDYCSYGRKILTNH